MSNIVTRSLDTRSRELTSETTAPNILTREHRRTIAMVVVAVLFVAAAYVFPTGWTNSLSQQQGVVLLAVCISAPILLFYAVMSFLRRYGREGNPLPDGIVHPVESLDQLRAWLASFAGRPLVHFDAANAFELSGIGRSRFMTAIGWDGENLLIVDHNIAGIIPLECIRNWECKTTRADQLIGPGLATTAHVGVVLANQVNQARVHSANIRAVLSANMASGVFVNVANINKPLWHFQSTDEAVLRRWQEILTSVFEERATAAAD